jgi:hypothetical protein
VWKPAQPLERELDLPDARDEGYSQSGLRAGAQNAVRCQPVSDLKVFHALDPCPFVRQRRRRCRHISRQVAKRHEPMVQGPEAGVRIPWPHGRPERGCALERRIDCEGPVTRQHSAQPAIHLQRRRELGDRLCETSASERRTQNGREVVIVGGHGHAEPRGTRIHPTRMQVPKVADHALG